MGRDTIPETAASSALSAERLIEQGNALEDAGDFRGALARYQRAAEMAPGVARAHMNIGNALHALERWDEAVAAARKAVDCEPDLPQARFNLALFLSKQGNHLAAERQLDEALRLNPDLVAARILRAHIFEDRSLHERAESEYRLAVSAAPCDAAALLNVGMFYLRQGCPEEASDWLRRAKVADAHMRGSDSDYAFALNFRSDLTRDEVARQHFAIGRAMMTGSVPPIAPWDNEPDADRRLRIGYVSGDFGPHPVGLFIRPVLQSHDRSAFEVFCYSNLTESTFITKALQAHAGHWRDIARLDDNAVSSLVRQDRIDILVDLAGHTNRGRLKLFASRPAPIQVTWLGYLNTTGVPAIDYRITDGHTDPVQWTESWHSETLVRMPNSQWCYMPWYDVASVPSPHPERPDAVIFGSFNQYAKLTERTLRLWARVLNELPESQLIVLDVRDQWHRDHLQNRLRRAGIGAARVTLRERQSFERYFAAMANVDIALDTTPYNGATTTLDALWMGVPVVALCGDRGISRGSYSILRTAGLDELIAYSDDEYVERHVQLARNAELRRQLRRSLRQRLASSPVTDARSFTGALEERFRAMWRSWCNASAGAG